MNINNYSTGANIGKADIDAAKYEEMLSNDHTDTGAVRAGDWLSAEQLAALNISADLTIFCD